MAITAMTAIEERWERLASRERRLITMLGATFAVCLGVWAAFRISDGLGVLETANAASREAIESVLQHQADLAAGKAKAPTQAVIGDETVALASYVDAIADELGVSLPETSPRTGPVKGKFQEKTIDVTVRNVTLDQLATMLQQVETRSPGVVTQRLKVTPYARQQDHMDVELTIATWERVKSEKSQKKDAAEANSDEAAGKDGKDGKAPGRDGGGGTAEEKTKTKATPAGEVTP